MSDDWSNIETTPKPFAALNKQLDEGESLSYSIIWRYLFVRDTGFTLIELMIVVAIIAIIAAIAIPNLIESKKAAHEASAVSSLRTLGSSQELYRARYLSYASLAELADKGIIDPILADSTGPTCVKAGYYYSCIRTAAWWCATARPGNPGQSGDRCFRIATNGVIYYKVTDDANIATASDVMVLK
jgi:prepilin-type N-terminal cleavage/methylation domain-containing protein